MEIVDRYIYAVTKRLNPKQKDDIEKELRGLIEDMMAERANDSVATESDAEEVLIELGDPIKLADKYRGSTRYLIGPDYYNLYLLVCKIVLAAVGFGITIAFIIDAIVGQQVNAGVAIGEYMGSLISSVFSVLVWVTIIFAINERYGDSLKRLIKINVGSWKPSSLPKIPVQKQLIKPFEPIFGIVFGVVFLIIVNTSSRLIGVYLGDSDISFIPIFQEQILHNYLPIINVLICVGIVKEFFKLIYGRWTISLAAINGALNAISLVIAIFILSNPEIWNPNIAAQLRDAGVIINGVNINFIVIQNQISRTFIAIFVISYAIDTIVATYKATKYRTL